MVAHAAAPALTPAEARVLWTVLGNTWSPRIGHDEWKAALTKLAQIGGGFCCRYCTDLARHPHRLGGWTCDVHHQTQEKEA